VAERPSTAGGRGCAPGQGTSLLPDDQVTAHGLVVRGIEAVEGSKGALHALEKSIDGLRSEVVCVGDRTAALDSYLARIAKAEEERTAMEKTDSARRAEWASKLWQSPSIQIGLTALIAGIMQLIGMGWLAKALIPVTPPGVAP